MELDDVRALKRRLLARPAESAVARRRGAGVALGVNPAPGGGFRLGVRVQRPGADTEPFVRAADGEADVREIGMVRAFERTARVRPLQVGVSVAEVDVTAGTLGCFVTVEGEARILSNNHVLANEDRARPGAAVLQPGPADGGRDPADRVGALIVAADSLDAVALLFAGNEEGVTYGNPIDAVLDALDATIRT